MTRRERLLARFNRWSTRQLALQTAIGLVSLLLLVTASCSTTIIIELGDAGTPETDQHLAASEAPDLGVLADVLPDIAPDLTIPNDTPDCDLANYLVTGYCDGFNAIEVQTHCDGSIMTHSMPCVVCYETTDNETQLKTAHCGGYDGGIHGLDMGRP
jgi:hypothetical protein